MAQASMDPSQPSARHTEEGARFDAVLFAALDALEAGGLPFAVIGGVAASSLGRRRATHDIDVFVRPEDAEAALQGLARHGFRTEKTDAKWLFKGFMDDVLVDVIFRSSGDIYFDEEMETHRRFIEYHGRQIPVVAPEDLIIIKCAVHTEGGPHHWHDALAILSHAKLNWEYLLSRARRAPRRLLALLIYAQSNDIWIPNHIITSLFDFIFHGHKLDSQLTPSRGNGESQKIRSPQQVDLRDQRRATPARQPMEYTAAHLKEVLAQDTRTAQQDLDVIVNIDQIVVKGECPSESICQVITEIIQTYAPEYRVCNQVRVSKMGAPGTSETIQ